MFKQLHPNIRLRITITFLNRVINSMIFPFMAIYFTGKMNPTIVGILLMVNVVVQFFSSIYGGFLADNLGRKKMMVCGELMQLFAYIMMVLANSPLFVSAWMTYFMMLIMSISSGLVKPASEAMLIDVSTKETRAFMYSVNYWATNMSIMIGSIVGGWFFKDYLFQLLIVLVGMSIFTSWLTLTFITETLTDINPEKKSSYGLKPLLHSYRIVIKDRRFLLFVLGGISVLSIEFQRSNYITVRLADEIHQRTFHLFHHFSYHLDGLKLLGILTVENTLMIVLFTGVASKLIRNKPLQRTMNLGYIFFTLGFMVLAFSNNIFMLVVSVFVLTVGELIYVPSRQSILADIIDSSQRGAYMAFNGFVFQIGKMIGSIGIVLGHAIGGIGMGVFIAFLGIMAIILCHLSLNVKQPANIKTYAKQL